MVSAFPGLALVLFGVTMLAAPAQDQTPEKHGSPPAPWAALPVYFVENRGVFADRVAYYVEGCGRTLFFERTGITIRLTGPEQAWIVKLVFVGSSPDVVPAGERPQPAVFSYFHGQRDRWKAGLGSFARVVYHNLWPGIDLAYQGTGNKLKYEFTVHPGADPARIQLRYEGAAPARITEEGALRVETPVGFLEDAPPIAWQDIGGRRVPVGMGYSLSPGGLWGFAPGKYDPTKTLVLDPAILVYCGYLGGTGDDESYGIAVDAAGNAYVTGKTTSTEQTFPVQAGPDLHYNGGLTDAFVAKINAAGTALVYCGYIGGSNPETGYGIAVDAAGNAYVTGQTMSTASTFPVVVGPGLTHKGNLDVFVAKINAAGTALLYCGYLGGQGSETPRGIAVDTAGSAYVVGYTESGEATFPVRSGPDLTFNGIRDAFVAKLDPTGAQLLYCGYLGGQDRDEGNAVAVDGNGNAYVTGVTTSSEATFPVKLGPDLTYNGAPYGDVFVAKINAAGTALDYCGYLGGDRYDGGFGIAVDSRGNAYVAGETGSAEQTFPATVGPDLTFNGGLFDGFVAKINAAGTALVYCGYLGGRNDDGNSSIALDRDGHAHVAGWTNSGPDTFPVANGLSPQSNGGFWETFVAKVNVPGSALDYCGYLGGNGTDSMYGIALDATGNAYVTGYTSSTETTFPVTGGPDLTYNGGASDVFVAKIAQTELLASGAPRGGATITLSLLATDGPGRAYQVGSSFGTGPIWIASRALGLSPDALLQVSVAGWWPHVFDAYSGVVALHGRATAYMHIPKLPALVGVRLHTAFVMLDPSAPSGVRSISNTESFMVTE